MRVGCTNVDWYSESTPGQNAKKANLARLSMRYYCVKNLYATINATMHAKISSAGSDFRIIGLGEWRAADRLG
jgi:hypothetical protein